MRTNLEHDCLTQNQLICLIEGDDERVGKNTHFGVILALINLTNSAPEANVAKSKSFSICSKIKLNSSYFYAPWVCDQCSESKGWLKEKERRDTENIKQASYIYIDT